jgi:hypothetical protein
MRLIADQGIDLTSCDVSVAIEQLERRLRATRISRAVPAIAAEIQFPDQGRLLDSS